MSMPSTAPWGHGSPANRFSLNLSIDVDQVATNG
ncbi:hypothetical protein PAN31108_02937 [Pandoraea anhela]|uniref:Uncharacterized protein n=1 Tax=Pandoraea anhela TaxID=2508295 RepID=A0A5E4W252_9BURK|nr:hypothetical protein PAN31108_02937 [Pandoraea anhela]